ncbi:MAG: helix-turn-helix domain-containing protein, partial [Planctomycetota bacterium]
MAGMFYSLQEVAAKLKKTEEEVKEIVKQGKLREFRDGPNLLFKVDEVEALLSGTSFRVVAQEAPSEETGEIELEGEEISLAPEAGEAVEAPEAGGVMGGDETAVSGEGINVLGETDGDYQLADDTMGETRAAAGGILDDDMDALSETAATPMGEASLEEIEEDVNLDTFGSGSGLLDLSLQADDTSLGGILDEIYTPEGEEGQEPKEASAMEVAAEAESMLEVEGGVGEAEPVMEAPAVIAAALIEPAPDRASNALGLMLFLPLLAVVYTMIVAIAALRGVTPAILTSIQGLILPVLGGLLVPV